MVCGVRIAYVLGAVVFCQYKITTKSQCQKQIFCSFGRESVPAVFRGGLGRQADGRSPSGPILLPIYSGVKTYMTIFLFVCLFQIFWHCYQCFFSVELTLPKALQNLSSGSIFHPNPPLVIMHPFKTHYPHTV